jgi:geranylgeranyl diphosphate synthase type II
MKSKEEYLKIVEDALDEILPKECERPSLLSSAMRYAVGTGGKRVRPMICLASAEAVGGKAEDAAFAAAAIELLHNYTLVHDDLPAMDNDVERRGRPTVWKKYSECDAILAGDALQALAFMAAAKSPNAGAVAAELASKAYGVVAGQVEDVAREKKNAENVDIPFIYEHKTADLFVAAALMGAHSAFADEKSVEQLNVFALNLGLAFQYHDDLIDGDSPYSEEETKRLSEESTRLALEALEGLPGDTTFLKSIAFSLLGRKV